MSLLQSAVLFGHGPVFTMQAKRNLNGSNITMIGEVDEKAPCLPTVPLACVYRHSRGLLFITVKADNWAVKRTGTMVWIWEWPQKAMLDVPLCVMFGLLKLNGPPVTPRKKGGGGCGGGGCVWQSGFALEPVQALIGYGLTSAACARLVKAAIYTHFSNQQTGTSGVTSTVCLIIYKTEQWTSLGCYNPA